MVEELILGLSQDAQDRFLIVRVHHPSVTAIPIAVRVRLEGFLFLRHGFGFERVVGNGSAQRRGLALGRRLHACEYRGDDHKADHQGNQNSKC